MEEIIDGVDDFYRDPANVQVPIPNAMKYFQLRVSAVPVAGVGNGFAGQIALEIGAGAICTDTDASDSLLCFIQPSRSVL
jgi:hypothetical protein